MHRERHPVDVPGCFGCKLLSTQFGMVPGAARQSNGKYYDKESLIESGLNISEEEVRDRRSDYYRNAAALDRETGL